MSETDTKNIEVRRADGRVLEVAAECSLAMLIQVTKLLELGENRAGEEVESLSVEFREIPEDDFPF